LPTQKTIKDSVAFGDIRLYSLGPREEAEIEVLPSKEFDLGAGKGKKMKKEVQGGVVGLVVDARGRPLELAKDSKSRMNHLKKWWQAINLYPQY
jgi:hypothetical protein